MQKKDILDACEEERHNQKHAEEEELAIIMEKEKEELHHPKVHHKESWKVTNNFSIAYDCEGEYQVGKYHIEKEKKVKE